MAIQVFSSLLAVIAAIIGTSGLSEGTSVSFHGGHYRQLLPLGEQDAFTVQFNFRSLQDSGVLLIATVRNSTDYVAVVIGSGSNLQLLLSQGGHVSTLDSINSTLDFSEWQSFELRLVNNTLSTNMQDQHIATHTFTASIEVDSVYFGGPESFFARLYAGFPLPRYYVGCMANLTLTSRPLQLDVAELPGLSAGCCVAPRYPLWCLDTPHADLTLTFPPVTPAADGLTVSFRLRLLSAEDGLVMLSRTLISLWSLQLLQGRLQLAVSMFGSLHTVYCPGGVFADSTEWHQVEVFLSSSRITCSVDGMAESASIFPSLLSTSLFPRLLQLGGASEHVTGRGFVGCFQRPRVNGVDIGMSLVESGEGTIRPPNVDWNNFSFNTTDLVVTERSTELLSSGVQIQLPHDEFTDDLTALYQLELENVIHFEVFLGPNFGHLYIGQRAARVESFDYRNILSDEPSLQVTYSHDNPDNDSTDVVVFRVWAGCEGVVIQEDYSTLYVTVEERDTFLRIQQSDTLRLAVGTRKVISPETVTVEVPETTSDPALVLFRVQFVSLLSTECSSSCLAGECCDERGGEVLMNGVSVKFFHQDDINRGVVSFQHFESYSTAPLVIGLGVSLEGSTESMMDITILVTLYQGHINLTSSPSSDCVFVKEDGLALISPRHLSVITNFEDQHPVITFDLLTLPKYGILQRYEGEESEWLDLANSTNLHAQPFGGESLPTSFTQADVNDGHVRYMQSETVSFNDPETFQFRVRSYDFSSNITAHLCVNIIPYDFLFQPSISVHLTSLVLAEGASAQINHTVFNTSLDQEGFMYLVVQPELSLQQLDVTYTLVEPPSFGRLELQGEILVAGDVFAHRDVTSSALVYFHDGTEDHDDRFSFYGETGSVEYLPIRPPNRTANLTLVIDVTPVNDNLPELNINMESIRPPEGCWVQVTVANINVTDIDRPADKLKIFLRKKATTPTGIFAFREEPDRAIAQFYMQDILDQRVIFAHQLDSSLNYTQVLRIDDTVHTIRKPILIAAVPLILEVSLSLPQNSQCFATIDADTQNLQVGLDSIKFLATLCDEFGNNAELVPAITVTIIEFPTHGHITREGPDNDTISQFQFHDLSSLVYVLEARNETGDVLELEFTHGHSVPVRHTLGICIQPALAPLRLIITALQVMQGGIAHITAQHLAVTSSREEEKNSLVFHVVRGPRYGSLLNERSSDPTRSLSQFTHGDLTRSNIVYDTSSILHTQDDIVVRVCSTFSCLPQQTLPIGIYPTSLTVQNSTIHVREGDTYHFQSSDFNVSAPPGYDIDIVISEDRLPMYGRLFIQTPFSNSTASYFGLEDLSKLRYSNDVLENLLDSVEINVEAEGPDNPDPLQFILWIVIDPVNHHAPEVISSIPNLTMVQGGTVLINASIFSAHDFDAGSDDDDLQWSMSILFYSHSGYLFLDTDPGNAFQGVRHWTERDIRTNRLYYRNTNSLHDILILDVSDGEKITHFQLLILIVFVDLKRYLASAFRLVEGGKKRISFDNLRYYSVNDDSLRDSDFLLTLQLLPVHGQLTLDGIPLLPHHYFTQEQLNSSQLLYIHDHSNDITDSFTFIISVPARQNGSKLDTFDIVIDAVDDDPPVAEVPARMFVVELQRAEIDNTTFRISDFDSRTKVARDRVVCQLVQPLTHGRLEKLRLGFHNNHTQNFTKFDLEDGHVWYRHLGILDQQPDQLVFNLTDGNNRQPTIYNMTIIILPRVVSLHLSALVVIENKIAVITYEEIMVNHPYLSTVGGIFRIEGSGPLHGRLVDTSPESQDNQIHSFTTQDITNKSISYYHNGDESLRDSFQFVYEALEPPEYNRRSAVETFYIDIIPVNDQHPVIHGKGNASLKLWATETVLIDENYFNITDYDTPRSKLLITFQVQTIGGYIAFANNTAANIQWFTQADVHAHIIRFVHVDGPIGQILYNVTDGEHTESSTIPIYADTLSLDCPTSQWDSIRVEFLGVVMVTSANLRCTMELNREITYHIPRIQLGHFEVNSQVRSEFNSTEVGAGSVTFVHTETGLWMESETLSVSASSRPASPESDLPLFVEVRYPRPPLGSQLAVNTGVNLTEGGSAVIDQSRLDGRNLRYAAWITLQSDPLPNPDTTPEDLVVLYQVVQSPRHGNLTLSGNHVASFTQRDLASAHVHYTHDDSETLADVVILNVTVQLPVGAVISHHDLESVHIAVAPINDQPPILQASALRRSLVRNFVTVLTSLDIEVTDDDNSPDQVQLFLLSLPNNTQILLNGSVLTVNSTVSQHHINQQWISLNPFAVGVSSFTFKSTDGELVSEEAAEFVLTVDDHFLRLIHSQEIVSFQNETSGTIIDSKHLNTCTNGYRDQTVFTVVEAPCCGRVMSGGVQVNIFTQEDIDHSKVSYVPESETYGDIFSLNISNLNHSLSVNVSVHIIALSHANSKTDIINFGLDSVQVLPPGVLLLDELKEFTSSFPIIRLLQTPTFGHLEMRVPLPDVGSVGKRATDEIREFRYDELQQGWIVYVWDYSKEVSNDMVTDKFEVLVRANDVLPGRAVITITLYPPSSVPFTPDLSESTSSSDVGVLPTEQLTSSENGFPVYTLVPIIGIILFLLLLIVVVVAFCLTQQKRIKKKWVPGSISSHHHHHSPWSASSPPIPTQVAHYDYDPSGMPGGENEHNSDTSSGFSEPDCSPRHTPLHSVHPHSLCHSPSYHPPRSRMRSNVSITFSSRQSTVSEETSADGDFHSSLSQYQPQTAADVMLPTRPSSHTAFSRPLQELDTGMISPCTVENSQAPADEEGRKADQPHEDDDNAFAEWTEGKALPDFNDPNIQRLFHAHNPVLKKEEYWV